MFGKIKIPTIASGQDVTESIERPMQKTGLWILAGVSEMIVVEKQKDDAFVAAFSNNSKIELRSLWL
jgi:hypothetical protein